MSPPDRTAPLPPPQVPGGREIPIGQAPVFWIACAAIFLANAVLASLYGEWLPALLGLITTGVALIAAAASSRRPPSRS